MAITDRDDGLLDMPRGSTEVVVLASIFINHGGPTLPLSGARAKHFLQRLPTLQPKRPRAILVVLAHWETKTSRASAVDRKETIHDVSGFQRELYDLRYAALRSPEVASRVIVLLSAAGISGASTRGLDHGARVPLLDVSRSRHPGRAALGPAKTRCNHIALGRPLAPLSNDRVIMLGSGSLTHDQSQFKVYRDATAEPEHIWVSAFADW